MMSEAPALEKMYELMSSYSDLGAMDSEPISHLHQVLRAADDGRVFPDYLARGANVWELYGEMRGCAAANRRLTAQARRVYRERRKLKTRH